MLFRGMDVVSFTLLDLSTFIYTREHSPKINHILDLVSLVVKAFNLFPCVEQWNY